MKVMKKLASGLVVNEQFNDGVLNEPLRVNASYSWGSGYIDVSGGVIYVSLPDYENLVFEVYNDFNPQTVSDMGGIVIRRGSEKQELYEYYKSDDVSAIPYVRVVKHGAIYNGYGSEDGLAWSDKGYVYFPSAESVGVTVKGNTPYRIRGIKAYKEEVIRFYSMNPDWTVRIYEGEELMNILLCTGDKIDIPLPYYPFSGRFQVYNGTTLVSDMQLEDLWGGDEFACVVDVDLYTLDGVPLTFESEQHLGNMQNGKIEAKYIARNNSNVEVIATVKVADYSPFGDWVSLSNDYGDVPGDYFKYIDITVPPLSDAYFWILITRPSEDNRTNFNYKTTECLFYLEVM